MRANDTKNTTIKRNTRVTKTNELEDKRSNKRQGNEIVPWCDRLEYYASGDTLQKQHHGTRRSMFGTKVMTWVIPIVLARAEPLRGVNLAHSDLTRY